MYRITTESGRVGHIAGSIFDGACGRVVTTACGQTHPEADFHVDDSLDACSVCDRKFFSLLEDETNEYATEELAEEFNESVDEEE